MAQVYKLNGATLDPKNVYLHWAEEEGFEGALAADGTGSFGSVTFHDLDGTLDVQGWMPFTIDETDCTTAPRLVTSWIWERTYTRGGDELTGAGRMITAQLLDPNALLSLRVITGSDGNRPAETVTQRIDWLLGSAYLSGLVEDTGFVNGGTSNLDSENLIGKYPAEVLASIAALGITDEVFFAFYDQTTTTIGLYYASATATTYQSTLSVSNVKGDLSSTCFFPSDASLNRNPSEVYSDIRYVTKAGVFNRFTAATRSTFFPSPLGLRGVNIENDRDGSSATSTRHADNYLSVQAAERDTITETIQVPSTHIGLIAAGMAMNNRHTHFPGYSTATSTRVERMTFRNSDRRRKLYDVTLVCTNRGLGSGIPAGGGDPGDFPHPPSGPPSAVDIQGSHTNIDFVQVPTDGQLILVGVADRDTAAPGVGSPGITGFTTLWTQPYGGSGAGMWVGWKIASGETTTSVLGGAGSQVVGAVYPVGTTIGGSAQQNAQHGTIVDCGGPLSIGAASVVWGFTFNGAFSGATVIPAGTSDTTAYNGVDVAGFPGWWAVYQAGPGTPSLSGSLTAGAADWYGFSVELVGSAEDNPPSPGQWVYGEVVTMAGAVGTTDFGYAAGSLKVKVDGVVISPASYTETDPAAGTFTLSWTPDSDETVTVEYQGI